MIATSGSGAHVEDGVVNQHLAGAAIKDRTDAGAAQPTRARGHRCRDRPRETPAPSVHPRRPPRRRGGLVVPVVKDADRR